MTLPMLAIRSLCWRSAMRGQPGERRNVCPSSNLATAHNAQLKSMRNGITSAFGALPPPQPTPPTEGPSNRSSWWPAVPSPSRRGRPRRLCTFCALSNSPFSRSCLSSRRTPACPGIHSLLLPPKCRKKRGSMRILGKRLVTAPLAHFKLFLYRTLAVRPPGAYAFFPDDPGGVAFFAFWFLA